MNVDCLHRISACHDVSRRSGRQIANRTFKTLLYHYYEVEQELKMRNLPYAHGIDSRHVRSR